MALSAHSALSKAIGLTSIRKMSLARGLTAPVVRASRAMVSAGGARRHVSGGPEELKMSMDMWFKTSVASIALIVTPFTIYTVAKELAHEHHEEGPAYPHMKVAHKRWPWTANCALFDIHCKKEWAAHH